MWLVCLPFPHQRAVNTTSLVGWKRSTSPRVILASWFRPVPVKPPTLLILPLGTWGKKRAQVEGRNLRVEITETFFRMPQDVFFIYFFYVMMEFKV